MPKTIQLHELSEKIKRADDLITTLSPEGESFVEAMSLLEVGFDIAHKEAEYPAYYNAFENVTYYPEDASFPFIFNMRVHEGTHAIQTRLTPHITDALNNLSLKNGKPILSLRDTITCKRLAENGAHSVQAFFNVLAVSKTQDYKYVNCLLDREGTAQIGRDQLDALSINLTATQIRELSILNDEQKAGYDILTISGFFDAAQKMEIDDLEKVSLDLEDEQLIVDAVVPFRPAVREKIIADTLVSVHTSKIINFLTQEAGLEL